MIPVAENYEIKPLTEEEETIIEEKIMEYANAIAPSFPYTEEEQMVFKTEDEGRKAIGGCVVNVHEWGRAVLAQLWVDERVPPSRSRFHADPCRRKCGKGEELLLSVFR